MDNLPANATMKDWANAAAAAVAKARHLHFVKSRAKKHGGESFGTPAIRAKKPVEREPSYLFDAQAEKVARDMVELAFANGLLKVPQFDVNYQKPEGGSTAKVVVKAMLGMEFFVKIDDNEKLAQEAENLRMIPNRNDLPDAFKACFPCVYAAQLSGPVYGYVMESFQGFIGFEKICFSGQRSAVDMQRIADRILDLLFAAYEKSYVSLIKPNIAELYIGRIKERLAILSRDSAFAMLMTAPLTINGHKYATPYNYLREISKKISRIEPSFTTFVHGDPNPENILVKVTASSIDVKFIDTKEWAFGDYLFDMGKLAHYLAVTGPVEISKYPLKLEVNAKRRTIQYQLTTIAPIERLINRVMERIEKLANDVFKDTFWKQRFALSMASNLLGLPAGRLAKNRRTSSVILYAEGLKWLKKVASELTD